MKLSKIFGFVLLATLVVALSGNVSQTGYAIPTGGPDFAYASATSYVAGATSLPVNPGMANQVIGVFALRDCANTAVAAPVTLGSGTTIPAFLAALCPAAPGDANPSSIVRMEVIQVGGSAPAGTFTNVRAYLDTELPAVPVALGVGGVFNIASDQALGVFTGDIVTGATLQAAGAILMQIAHLPGAGVTKLVYIVADVSPTAQLGVTAVVGLTVQTDNVDLGGGPVVSSQPSSGVVPPVQSVLQVAVGAAQTGQARGVAADLTTQLNVVNNITPNVPANTEQIMQVIGICSEGTSVVGAPSSGGAIFIGTLYPSCSAPTTANGAGLVVQQLVIQKLAGSLPNATVHVYVDRNGNALPDSSEQIGLGFPWPNTNTPLVLGTAGNAFLSGPVVVGGLAGTPILTATGLINSAFGAGTPPAVGGNECGAANLLTPSAAATATGCGINLIITLESASSGDIQIGTTINTGDIPRLGLAFVGTNVLQTPMPVRSLVRATIQGAPGPGPGPVTLVASVGKAPKKPAKSMTYKDVFVSATGPAGASKVITGFSVPGCTVSKVTGPVGATAVVGGAPIGPFKVKVKCPTKPATVPGLTPLRAGSNETDGVPSLIPLRAGSVGTVEVFTITGKKVLETGFSGGALDATKLDLPNGVYLYVVTVQGPDGRLVKSEIKKLVVTR